MVKAKKFTDLFEKLTPILLVATIALSFTVGVLWQKVSSLEKGGTGTGAGTGVAPTTSPLADLPKMAATLKIDKNKFQTCFASEKYAEKVNGDYQEGTAAGVTGTPASFIVNARGDVWFVPGAFPYESVKTTIDIALGNAPESTLPTQIVKLDAAAAGAFPKMKDSDHVKGDRSAKVAFIEYSDFQCPFCQRFHPTVQQITKEYARDVAYIYRHYPLDQIHPYARPAAVASECVAEIGGEEAFWKFADLAFGN